MRRGRCGANLLIFEDEDGTIRHDSGFLGYSTCRHGGVKWQEDPAARLLRLADEAEAEGMPNTADLYRTQATIGCVRYGCWRNPRTGHCNRCGREV